MHNLKKERFILAQLQRFQSMVGWLHCCGPKVRQNIMAAEADGRGACSSRDSWEAERDTRRSQDKIKPPRTCP
jgi:hypothetical protein